MIILSILFFVTAILYSSVGFGGGSTYLAFFLMWEFLTLYFPDNSFILQYYSRIWKLF